MKNKVVNELRMELDAKSENESFARYAVSAFLCPLDPTVGEVADIRTVVSEAVTNCIVHAYPDELGLIQPNGDDDALVFDLAADAALRIVHGRSPPVRRSSTHNE